MGKLAFNFVPAGVLMVMLCADCVAQDPGAADAPGFFRIREEAGVHWLVDPTGSDFFSVGVGHVRYSGQGCERLGYSPYQAASEVKYGSEDAWREATVARLREWGFNTLGELSDRGLQRPGIAHTAFAPFGYIFAQKDGLPTPDGHTFTVFPNVFNPEWPQHCARVASELCAGQRDDPWLLGYFIDNELTWRGSVGREWGLFSEAWKKPAEDPAKEAWIVFLRGHFGGPDELREHFGVQVESWEELAAHTSPLPPLTDHARAVALEWVGLVAERYFKAVVDAIRLHDPHHLILGPRFVSDVPPILDVAGRYCDVITVNFYPQFDPGNELFVSQVDLLRQWHEQSGRPILLSEWSFPALDSGLPCTLGAGMRVETQEQRAQCWATLQERLFRTQYVIGSNYFAWSDEPAFGIASFHPENTNYGIVDENDRPYAPLVREAVRLNPRAGEMHREGGASPGVDVPALVAQALHFSDGSTIPETLFPMQIGALNLDMPGEGNAWRISFHEKHLARLVPRLLQIAPGWRWPEPETGVVVAVRENDRFTAVDVLTDAPREPGAYRSLWRLLIPKRTRNWVAARCMWVENRSSEPWRLLEVQLCVESDLGGDSAGDKAFPLDHKWRPFYRNGSYLWDAGQQLGIGATFAHPEDFEHYFASQEDGRGRGELRHTVDRVLGPGERHETPSPIAVVFLMEHDAAAHFARKIEWILGDIVENAPAPPWDPRP